jgi:hypothetical protein
MCISLIPDPGYDSLAFERHLDFRMGSLFKHIKLSEYGVISYDVDTQVLIR